MSNHLFKKSKELDNLDEQMKKLEQEIETKIHEGDEKGAWENQIKLNSALKAWRTTNLEWLKALNDDPNIKR